MKPEKTTYIHNGKERIATIEHGRNCIATDDQTGFSGNGGNAQEAIAALVRNLNTPDPRIKK